MVTANSYLPALALMAPHNLGAIAVWAISLASIACMLLRPHNVPEAYWVSAGAVLLVITRLITLSTAGSAVHEGLDVYLFLTGMMLLAELARREGVFDWLADLATCHARGSATRLFLLIYAVGTVVTVFLSNDATAVVLTPAVFAAVKRAKAKPLPYLFTCAFIANAASFVLPISNPANLVIFGKHMPPLGEWLKAFAIPSVISIAITLLMLWLISRRDLKSKLAGAAGDHRLSTAGRLAAFGLLFAAAALLTASALGWDLGLPTCIAALVVVAAVTFCDRGAPLHILRGVSWSVLPLVAGLFVIVEALNRYGALKLTQKALQFTAHITPALGRLNAAFGVGLVSNVMNNLPMGLASGTALQRDSVPPFIVHAVLVGVDLGPNLSVTGSLATVLWLIALRREEMHISAWEFFKAGIVVMPLALLLSALSVGI